MSTENHDQPAVPEGSAAEPAQTTPGPAAPAPELPRPVQTVSAPPAHPQAQPTQELHPQQQPTAPYPQQYGAPRPQPQYGQYAHGHHYGQAPYGQHAGQQPASVPPRAAYPQQGPGSSFVHPSAAAPASGIPGEPGAPAGRRERKPRGWVPVVSAAAIAAVLASGGTAIVVNALDDGARPASISDIGNPGRVDTAPVQESTVTNPDWTAVTAAVQQSVVSIQMTSAQGSGLGSGLIIDDDGHVLTNNHVVTGATDNTVGVTLFDGRVFSATIVGTDPTTDLAVVKIENAPGDLKPVALGDSDKVSVGDPVLAVGNPLGLANTATTGIVSALDRPVVATGTNTQEQVVTNAIQIDAAINPGNSGGPLFNAQGQVIGITSSIASLSGGLGGQSGSIGLGFAIPVNLAKNISSQLIENGTAQHAFIGVNLENGTATADGVTRRGALVRQVTTGSPAADAGIQVGDVIVAIGDQPVNGSSSLTAFVREYQAGQRTTLTLVRDGQAKQVDITLAVRDETPQQQQQQPPQQQLPGDGSDQGSDDGSLWDRLFGN